MDLWENLLVILFLSNIAIKFLQWHVIIPIDQYSTQLSSEKLLLTLIGNYIEIHNWKMYRS